jgi:hypothetical protein
MAWRTRARLRRGVEEPGRRRGAGGECRGASVGGGGRPGAVAASTVDCGGGPAVGSGGRQNLAVGNSGCVWVETWVLCVSTLGVGPMRGRAGVKSPYFVGPPSADRSYLNFNQLPLADGS